MGQKAQGSERDQAPPPVQEDAELPSSSLDTEDVVRVLVVDDEKMVRSLLSISLQRLGYQVVMAANGREALELFEQHDFDLVLLDVIMPDLDGFAVCKQLRKISAVPILMLTALNRPDDIVRGLELGADNYVTKPFTFKEVEARIRAILRRTSNKLDEQAFQVIELGDVRLNSEQRTVSVAGRMISLTRTEFRLLQYLMANANRPVSKQDLLENVWGYESADGINSNLVELAIRRLRKKLEEDPSQPQRLVTVRGVGYKFCVHAPPAPGPLTSGSYQAGSRRRGQELRPTSRASLGDDSRRRPLRLPSPS
ncbi:response regulator transcription factor [Litorilinea aerophila]|nr:response regulator transcription factor [Litorilinea aerophila]MCC9074710.1 response regulator transcription factor [Litorilinea aerophila]